jgi:hypothetical protein
MLPWKNTAGRLVSPEAELFMSFIDVNYWCGGRLDGDKGKAG